jgi:predicted nucleotidyltransferase component of viral defense system
MAQEIDINLNVNAEQADKSLGSLKSQLREAQQDVQKLADKFGATSREAVEAAKRAAELKDRIGDAKSLTEAFNPDAKFKALSASLSGVAGGFAAYQGAMGLVGVESKDLEKQLLKVQSAMAIAQGFQALGEARDSFKQLKAVAIDAFNGIKTAIGSTGIGLLVVAAGALYAYWDDIKAAVSGVSEEQKKLNVASQKNADIENEKLKAIGNQDNILKLQGKSEKEILDIKIKQTDEAITANKINQENQIINNKLAVEGAKRNFDMLQSYLEFISMPIRFLYENGAAAINKVIALLNKVPGIDIKYNIDEKFGNQAVDYLAKLAFDPEKVKKDGEATVKASQDTINKLLNDRAGYQLGKMAIDKKAELSEEDKQKKLKELTKEYNEDIAKTQDEFDLTDLQKTQDKLNADAKFKEDQIAAEQAYQLKITQLQYDSQYEREQREEEARQRKIESFQATTDAVASIAQSGEQLLSAIQATGLARGKAGQAAMKALALVQIGADSAIAFSKMMQGTEQSAAGAASGAPGPAAPAVYLATKIAFYASGTATILANIARAKALLSGGGGGGGGAAAAGGGGGPAAAPSFNVVGPSGANQIAESIGNRDTQPLKAFVVGGDVTTQQGLNRGIVQNATLG